jgi:hypothetical protein
MKGGKRALSPWNKFVSKVYHEGKESDPEYQFKDALKDASKRKSEMGSLVASGVKKSKKYMKGSRKGSRKGKKSMMGGTRRYKKY